MKKSVIIFSTLFLTLLTAQTVDPIYITLNGDVTHPDQEISGLAWNGNNLILLPQYPDGVIFSIPKQEIIEFLESRKSTITPKEISWETNKIEKDIKGFEGYESIVFDKGQLYVTIEAEHKNQNCGYIVIGAIKDCGIKLEEETLKKIETPVTLRNMTFETILLSEESVITIYEVNSEIVNENPFYYEFDRNLDEYTKKAFPFTDYRITDATELDEEGKFWCINYFWPGDFKLLNPNADFNSINKNEIKPVERLLEFQLLDDSIIRTNKPPVKIKLSEFGDSRNWEGIVRLDDIGFLIATDKFPGSILAFVPYSK